ncbi:putative colanic acid biosynthesis acetyltransferase WcaF [Spirosoma oryzae]|uniref:Putative colanic acid biosynthesis acetyltransferase WcaF n=1 Tax=Spirosoma oryzae TaxID=1469603 RepID=A0A2T0TET2_9BACT|nr:colanic acid biosynthesis acetyltransferase WcaF [Spirosoma oryzae]PRY44170.1 putative colanic acid biosynthesis acetyltransferase WcaF [Spirosoma oryzae]
MSSTSTTFDPVQTTPFTFNVKLKAHLWKIINRTIFRLLPLQVRSYRIFLLRIFGAKLANTVTISPLANIDYPWNLKMGHLSSLGDGAWAYCLASISIGDRCCIGKDVYLLTGSHDIEDTGFNMVTKPIIINDCCWIATGAYILPGIEIGACTVVAARSVVVKNTASFTVVGGNPAKFVKTRIFKNGYDLSTHTN